jgi:MFS family permease
MFLRAIPMAFGAVSRDFNGMVRRAKRNAVLSGIAALCFATAYVAGVVAVGAYLAPIFGPAVAALLIAVIMAVTGLVFIAVLSFLKHRDQKRKAHSQVAQRLGLAAAVSILPQLTKSKGLMVTVALGGLAILAAQALGGEDRD